MAIGSGSGLIARFRDAKASAKVRIYRGERLDSGGELGGADARRQPEGKTGSMPASATSSPGPLGIKELNLSPAPDSYYNVLCVGHQTYFPVTCGRSGS